MLPQINQIAIICFCFLNLSTISAQGDNSWWKSIFRTDCDTTQIQSVNINNEDSILNNASIIEIERDSCSLIKTLPALPIKDGNGSVIINMDSALTEIDLNALSETHTLKGYRVQIHFGNLETARAVRAKCRKRLGGRNVYLESIAPNYSVVVGDFRNRWEAESALPRLKKLYPSALIIPTDIELPKL
jgi:hypothetical protein